MSNARGVYTKDQLHTISRKRCPETLAKFSRAKVFHIQPDTQGDGHPELRIGYSTGEEDDSNNKEFLWVKESTDDAATLRYFTIRHGDARPAPATKKYHFKGEGIFGKLYKDGLAHGGIAMHALFKYVMLLCGYKAVFKDRLDYPKTIAEQEEGDLRGLVIALKQIAKRMPDLPVLQVVVGEEDDVKPVIASEGTKKRAREAEDGDEEAKLAKKFRIDGKPDS
tara:strand:+ start:122 stop:790 length:669 start_codon:yes stop_codon:yes gene_type:complete